jgi:hypothetical protein
MRPHAWQKQQDFDHLSEIHNQCTLNIWKKFEKVRGFYPRLAPRITYAMLLQETVVTGPLAPINLTSHHLQHCIVRISI